MANKDKIIKQAGKYIAKGQLDKAIKELQKAVALDPADVRTLLKLGDVYSKKEDRANATKIYRQVADSYSEQGFFLKAVAVHKQILKHDGDNLEVRLKLAELYEQLGLASEAQSQYQEVARIHDAVGDTQGSLQVLERLVELDSENVASRIKLAEGYSRAGQVEEAVKAFAKAAEVLKRQARIDDYVKVAERLVYHDPDRFEVVKDLARVYLSRGDTKRGLAKLQLCFKAQPRDVETLTLLAQAFLELGQTQKTVFVYKELATVYSEQGHVLEAQQMHRRILELDPSDPDANQALGLSSASNPPLSSGQRAPRSTPPPPPQPAPPPVSTPQAPASGAPPRFTSGLEPPAPSFSPPPAPSMAPRPPAEVPAPSFAPRPPAPTPDIPIEAPVPSVRAPASAPMPMSNPPVPDEDRRIQDIITETDVFVRYGLTEKALDHLRKVFDLDPDNVLAFRKMRDIHLSAGDSARAAEAVANMMHAFARQGDDAALDEARGELARLAPGHPLAHGGLPGAIPPAAPHHEDEELSIDITEDSGVIELGDLEGAPPPPPVYDFGDEQPVAGESTSAEAEGAFDFAMPAEATDAAPRPLSSPFITDPTFDPIEPGSESTDLPPAQAFDANFDMEAPQESWAPDEGLIDAPAPGRSYDSGGVFDDDEATMAAPSLFDDDGAPNVAEPDGLATDAGPRPPLPDDDPFAENVVTEFPDVIAEAPDTPFGEDEPLEDEEPTGTGSVTPDIDLDAEFEEIEFYIDNGLLEEARDALDAVREQAPDHPRTMDLQRTLDLASAEDDEDDEDEEDEEAPSPDPTAEIAAPDILGADPLDFLDAASDSSLREPSTEAPGPAISALRAEDPGSASADVDSAFDALGDSEPEAPAEDPDDQYDMGMVMMETLQFDVAIEAFRSASHSERRGLSALEMIGNCYRQKGQPLDAIDYYVDALDRGADGSAATNLMYEIGAAYEEAGELQRALEWMERCAAADPKHRDVHDRIGNIATQIGAPKPNGADHGAPSRGPTSSKKNKISYL